MPGRRYQPLNIREGSHDPWPVLSFDHFIDPYRVRLTCDLVDKFAVVSSAIVDVGCGDGRVIEELYHRGYHNLYGIDHSDEAIRRTHLRYRYVTTLVGDVTQTNLLWPTGNGKKNRYEFDGAICTEVLEHLPNDEDVSHVMRNIYDALKLGGWTIISIPNDNICVIDDDHRRLFNPGDEVAILADAGFKRVKQVVYHYSSTYPRPWMYATGVKE